VRILSGGSTMRTYEIRILSDGKTSAIYMAVHLNDRAAIRAAERMAVGMPFEVWRDMDCVYGRVTASQHSPTDTLHL
jgi:hypothetical protein